MNKPIVFISHATKDKDILNKLLRLLQRNCSNTVTFFLSSDGQSVQFGSNWVYSIEKALNECNLLLSFISPNSVKSQWLLFEMGVAYSRKIKVVPIGILGIDLARLPPPISLLQGFNLASVDGLNNIINLINNVFEYSFQYFNEEDYFELFSSTLSIPVAFWGANSQYIDELYIIISKDDLISSNTYDVRPIIDKFLALHDIKIGDNGSEILGCGFSISLTSDYPNPENVFREVVIRIDPYTAESTYHFVEDMINNICKTVNYRPSTTISLNHLIRNINGTHRIAARLYDLGMAVTKAGQISYKEIEFFVYNRKQTNTKISYKSVKNGFFSSTIGMIEILDILINRSILFIESSKGTYYEANPDEY